MKTLEEMLIAHAAETLAGHKAGSLFCLGRGLCPEIRAELERLNLLLSGKGVRLTTLCRCRGAVQVYVYRESLLRQALNQRDAAALLHRLGYPAGASLSHRIAHLRLRFQDGAFPHELGLFLGYPAEDVLGFIENGGRNYRLLGPWKVYQNEAEAIRRFSLYKKCRRIYAACYQQGLPVTRLTVAA